MTSSAFDAWKQHASATPIATAVDRLHLKLRKVSPAERAGPCPRPGCGGNDRFAINIRKNLYNCRHCGGGNAIDLVMMAKGVEFLAACEILTGEPPPARETQVTDADRARWADEARAAAELAAQREEEAEQFREKTRGTLNGMWKRALPIAGTPAEAYIERRGLRDPPGLRARCILDMPFYSGDGDFGDILARAPVLILPLVDIAGTFRGLHLTYIDLAQPKGRLVLFDKDGKKINTKKMRGTKVMGKKSEHPNTRNKVEIVRCENPRQIVLGEGFEKTLAVWMALEHEGRDLSSTAFWSACDLGNLAGKSAKSLRHPVERTDKNRPKMISGQDPDPEDPGIPIPDTVTDLVLLGDSTSDRFTTHCAMHRAQLRYARPGRTVRVAWAPEGKDFDDVLREAA